MKTVLSADENRRVAQAMLDYRMLAGGDRVLMAVSGGIDSLTLAWLLQFWRRKAPFEYETQAVHVDMQPVAGQPSSRARLVARQVETMGISCEILPAEHPAALEQGADSAGVCYRCARSRRRQLFEHARREGYSKLALGHHRDDVVETFFINLTSGGNISTMRPKQELFSGRLALIRPLAYLVKEEIRAIGERLGLEPIPSYCPLSEHTRRKDVRNLLEHVYAQIPGSREHVFAALGNVRTEYMLLQNSRTQQRESHADIS